MVAVNNRLFQKTKNPGSYEKECKQTVDHMKKKIQEKPETYTYIQRRLEAVTYI